MATVKPDCLVSLRGLTKTFKEPISSPFRKPRIKQALSAVDMEIPQGQITCLLGPNGAGKTTLIKILSCLITADSGEIRYRGAVLDAAGKIVQGRIGLVTPNERSFYWRLTGRENLDFFGSLHNLHGKKLRERVAEVLGETGMTDSADKPYRLYSAGMKQKLNIARALLGSPELFLLDEPAAHLDPLAREEFWNFVSGTLIGKRGATVFLCTHDLQEARRLADQVVVLDAGRIVAKGSLSELRSLLDTRKELVIRFRGELPQAWLARWDTAVRPDGPDAIRVRFDEAVVAQEEVIRSFVDSGGSLYEVYASADDLLSLLHSKVGRNV